MSVAKKKRISKKNKSAWRKTDIADVEEYLEEQRQEERIGTFADKKDEELFVVDATPTVVKPAVLTEKQKRKLNAKKPLRSLAALENTSKVQDPIVKRNHVKQKKSGRQIEAEVINPTKPRHFQANKDRLQYYEKVEKRKKDKKRPADEDIWEDKDFRDKIPNLKDEKGWISRDLSLHVVKNIGKPVVKVHDSIRHRTTKAKNFVAPHPGTSYNPSLEDHKDLLKQVVDREEKIITTEKHLKRVTTKMFSKLTPEEAEERRMKEMMAGLESDEEEKDAEPTVKKETKESKKDKAKAKPDEEAEEKVDSDDERPYKSVNAPVENKKKTRQDRNRELRHRERERKAEEKRALKKQEAELNRLKSIKSEVLVEEAELNVLKKHRKKVELKKKFETKRLGRLKYEEPEVDVNMAEDIRGNLREVKTESSLVVDRFKSFQKRNILPVSKLVTGIKKPKVKRFPRSSHKEAGVSYDMLRAKRKAAKAEKGGGGGS